MSDRVHGSWVGPWLWDRALISREPLSDESGPPPPCPLLANIQIMLVIRKLDHMAADKKRLNNSRA